MYDQNIKAELRKLGLIVVLILVIYVGVYIFESRTQFLTRMFS